MPTFKHSGDMGDCCFSLVTIKALGGGTLYIDPAGGLSSPLVKWQGRNCTKLTPAKVEAALPFFRSLSYIEDAQPWDGEKVDYDLDTFRQHVRYNNLADSHLAAFGLPFHLRDVAWLECIIPTKIENKPIVISRNLRYQANDAFWEANLPQFAEKSVFVGSPLEHEVFETVFGHRVQHVPTPTLVDLARVIAGCSQFIGNEGLPRAIAEGYKKPVIVEMGRLMPNTQFIRKDAQYV